MLADEGAAPQMSDADETPANGTREWLNGGATPAPAMPRREGTLFERMSNIARGAAKAQVDDEAGRTANGRDPLDIPRFLNRQNNQ